ncbi:hypothetical protein GALL_553250 [mine drainage metagenome]|uniref:Uncharacterized protein n=1 Tax=mine drainage metagenome TaxID=410659 RepID=A0A1J5NY48_9ZZZZ
MVVLLAQHAQGRLCAGAQQLLRRERPVARAEDASGQRGVRFDVLGEAGRRGQGDVAGRLRTRAQRSEQ